MAVCGIKKYDDLPGRVGWRDVDAMRAYYGVWKRKLESVTEQLERAYQESKRGGR